ncbi:hypothetical protein [Demequina rhizosphaerae]|uniref:hypothetical protein n=1 Tax=Demequina rhizosphaerae TaxID=1638985 RepID=UPI0007866D94|nr:hypothetical protein [Demequina rhizosphaerae]
MYVLTNRFNTIAFAAARMIGPAEMLFRKRYPDLGDLVEGVPVTAPPFPKSLVERASAASGPQSVVAIECVGATAGPPGAVADFGGPVLWTEVVAVHVPSDAARRSLVMTRHANVEIDPRLVQSTPELFTPAGHSDPTAVVDATRAAAYPRATGQAFDWHSWDAVRGAANGMRLGAQSDGTRARAAAFIEMHLSTPSAQFAELAPTTTADHCDRAVFTAACEALSGSDAKSRWRPSEIAEATMSRSLALVSDDDDRRAIRVNLDRVRELARSPESFEPFKSPTRGLASAKALLLVLLRRELERIYGWDRAMTGADPETHQLALAMAGALRGVSREHWTMRSTALDDAAVGALVRGDSDTAGFEVHTGTDGELLINGVPTTSNALRL